MKIHKWKDIKHRKMTLEQIARGDRRVKEQVASIRRREKRTAKMRREPPVRTSFDDFFDEKMADLEYASAYVVARAKVDRHDGFVRRRLTRLARRPAEEIARVFRPPGRLPRNKHHGSRLEAFLAWSGIEGGDRVLLVGQSSSAGITTRRLLVLMGISRERYLQGFDRANVLVGYRGPSKSGKGDVFPRVAVLRARAKILSKLKHGSLVVALGRGVAGALGAPSGVPFFQWSWLVMPGKMRRFADGSRSAAAVLLAVAPNLSEAGRWWTQPKNVKAVRLFFKGLVRSER